MTDLSHMIASAEDLEDVDMYGVEDDDASFVDDTDGDSDNESGDRSALDDEFIEEVEDMKKMGLLKGREPGYGEIPVIYPRCRFTGACNIETVKDGTSPVLLLSP